MADLAVLYMALKQSFDQARQSLESLLGNRPAA
jgi:hypothetical protein